MKSLRERVLDVPQVGTVSWIGVRREHGAELSVLSEVEALEGRGLRGDVAAAGSGGGTRQVTLVQAEHLPVLAAWTQGEVTPGLLRRNLLISGINLIALAKLEFRIGADVVLLGSGACAPCSKMDDTLGPGGFQAMRGHGGITAQVLRGGLIRLGDRVWVRAAR
jgi:MOSC domain-containing protein YiiM